MSVAIGVGLPLVQPRRVDEVKQHVRVLDQRAQNSLYSEAGKRLQRAASGPTPKGARTAIAKAATQVALEISIFRI